MKRLILSIILILINISCKKNDNELFLPKIEITGGINKDSIIYTNTIFNIFVKCYCNDISNVKLDRFILTKNDQFLIDSILTKDNTLFFQFNMIDKSSNSKYKFEIIDLNGNTNSINIQISIIKPIGRDAFIGRWSVKETWKKFTYEVRISPDINNIDKVNIYNFANLGSSYFATAKIKDYDITLDNQIINDFQISGSGKLNNNIDWIYSLRDGGINIVVFSTYTIIEH